MRVTIALFLLPMLAFTWNGCSSKSSAIDEWKNEYTHPVDALRISSRDKAEEKKMPQSDEPSTTETEEKTEPALDLSDFSKNKQSLIQRLIIVTEEKAPLYKGPSSKYPRLAFARQNQKFKLLRTIQGPESDDSWHLIQDRESKNFYISASSARVIEKKLATSRKEVLQSKITSDPVSSKGLFDPTPPLPQELIEAKNLTLNFEQTNIYEIITTFCELLKINYLIEGKLDGKVTLQTFRKVPTSDLYSVFEQILAVNGIAVVKSGNFYRFLPIKDSTKKPLNLHYGNKPGAPAKDRVVIQLIPLKNLPPATIKKTIAPLITKDGILLDIPETNILMLIDLASSAKQITHVVEAIDTDKTASSDIQLYAIHHSDPEVVVEELNEIFSSIGYGSALNTSLMFIPLVRIDSILVVSSLEDIIERVDFWIEKLDQPISTGDMSTFVYYIQNAEAEKLAGILNDLFGDKGSKNISGGAPKAKPKTTKKSSRKTSKPKSPVKKTSLKVEGGIKEDQFEGLQIIPDKDTNSLIIRIQPKSYPAILEIIKKLDLLPQQVLIEVLILDLLVDEETRLGVQWAMKGTVGDQGIDNGAKILGGGSDPAGSLGAAISDTATSLFAPGASFFINRKDKFIALLQAFAADGKVNTVANPILITSDNKEANISIADDIPIASSTINTPTAGQPLTQSTIQYRSVGIKLGIVPKINSDNFVNMKIDQEISNLGVPVPTGLTAAGDPINTPSFTTRTIKTEVVLKDNQVLVMGGLIRSRLEETVQGVPFLMDIPLIGRLFSSSTNTTEQTELMLFIIPHIISNSDDSKLVTEEFKNRLGGLIQTSPYRMKGSTSRFPVRSPTR